MSRSFSYTGPCDCARGFPVLSTRWGPLVDSGVLEQVHLVDGHGSTWHGYRQAVTKSETGLSTRKGTLIPESIIEPGPAEIAQRQKVASEEVAAERTAKMKMAIQKKAEANAARDLGMIPEADQLDAEAISLRDQSEN